MSFELKPLLRTGFYFNNQIVRGVLRQSPDIDIVRIQAVDLSGADDPTVLAWAAEEAGCAYSLLKRSSLEGKPLWLDLCVHCNPRGEEGVGDEGDKICPLTRFVSLSSSPK